VELARSCQVGTNIVRRALQRIIERRVSGLEAEDKANGDPVTVTSSGSDMQQPPISSISRRELPRLVTKQNSVRCHQIRSRVSRSTLDRGSLVPRNAS
jgi:hypothetical protein